MVFFDAHAECEGMFREIQGEVVLQLIAVVIQLVVRCKRLKSKGRVVRLVRPGKDLDLREPRPFDVLAALITRVVADNQVVGLVAAHRGVPLAHDGADVLQDRVVRIRKIQGSPRAAAEA